MKTRRAGTVSPNRERRRIKSIRDRFQREKPSLADLLARGDYDGPVAAEDAWPVDQLLSRLRRLREASGLTQRQLAMKAGMNVTSISRLESGRQANVTIETLQRLAKGLGCSLCVRISPRPDPRAA